MMFYAFENAGKRNFGFRLTFDFPARRSVSGGARLDTLKIAFLQQAVENAADAREFQRCAHEIRELSPAGKC